MGSSILFLDYVCMPKLASQAKGFLISGDSPKFLGGAYEWLHEWIKRGQFHALFLLHGQAWHWARVSWMPIKGKQRTIFPLADPKPHSADCWDLFTLQGSPGLCSRSHLSLVIFTPYTSHLAFPEASTFNFCYGPFSVPSALPRSIWGIMLESFLSWYLCIPIPFSSLLTPTLPGLDPTDAENYYNNSEMGLWATCYSWLSACRSLSASSGASRAI